MRSINSRPRGSLPSCVGQYFISHLEGGPIGNEVSSFFGDNELAQVPCCGMNYMKIWVMDIEMPHERKRWAVVVFRRNSSKLDSASSVL